MWPSSGCSHQLGGPLRRLTAASQHFQLSPKPSSFRPTYAPSAQHTPAARTRRQLASLEPPKIQCQAIRTTKSRHRNRNFQQTRQFTSTSSLQPALATPTESLPLLSQCIPSSASRGLSWPRASHPSLKGTFKKFLSNIAKTSI